jgi:2-oxoglutarate ferredoxin oxidoreductase subunit beta
MLTRMRYPEFPEPVGVFRCVQRPCFEQRLEDQIEQAVREQGEGDLEELFLSGDVWTVEP